MDQPHLNMRQRRQLDVVKDYDCEILYHLGNANVVADALSYRAVSALIRDMCMRMTVMNPVLDTIREAQAVAIILENHKRERVIGQISKIEMDSRGAMTFLGRIQMPYMGGAQRILMEEAYKSRFSIHPGSTKMYLDLKNDYWWPSILMVYRQMFDLPQGQGKEPASSWLVAGKGDFPMEVGTRLHGFYHKIVKDCKGCRYGLGDCGTIDKECSLFGQK